MSRSRPAVTHITLSHNHSGNGGNGGEGSGMSLWGDLTLGNSTGLPSSETPGSRLDLKKDSGNITIDGINCIGDPSGSTLSAGPTLLTAPLLAPLGDYGGPTETMPPLPGSPLNDAAGISAETTDQCGFARPNGPAPDIGAAEAHPFNSLTLVDTDLDGIDDRLEQGLFGNLFIATATASSDKDEIANLTNPNDSTDLLRIISMTKAASFDPADPQFDVTFSTFPGLEYELETNSTLSGAFTPIPGSSFTATGTSKTLSIALTPGKDFVRAKRK